jgi:predicted RNA-binding Zn ribbon-like protein
VWDGGRPCLDLVNTYRDRKTGGAELLREPADLDQWLLVATLVQSPTAASARQLDEAATLREAINGCIDAVLTNRGCVREDLDVLNRWAARWQPPHPLLEQEGFGPPSLLRIAPPDPVAAALAELAADAATLLGTQERAMLRICASDTCGLRFVDRSPAGRRQWCSMRRCGNRAKARAHRARTRTTSPSS